MVCFPSTLWVLLEELSPCCRGTAELLERILVLLLLIECAVFVNLLILVYQGCAYFLKSFGIAKSYIKLLLIIANVGHFTLKASIPVVL